MHSATVDVIDNGSGVKYILKKLFPPFKLMKVRNPILNKVPILLPWFYFTRLIRGLFNFKTYNKRYHEAKSVDDSDISRIKKIKEITGVELWR